MFYKDGVKIIPRNLDRFLTPLALATLYLSGTRLNKEIKLPVSLILLEDIKYLSVLLKNKYNILTNINKRDLNNCKDANTSLQIKKTSLSTFSNTLKPHLLPSLYHLLNKPIINLNLFRQIENYSGKKNLSDPKYTLKYKKEYVLSLEQKEALIGIILGDGSLDRGKPSHNTRLRLEQSYPEKEKYLNRLYELFKPMTTMSPTILTRNDKRNNTTTSSLYFRTLAMPCLNHYYDLFYKERAKIIPLDLNQLLSARGLAY